MVQGVIIKKYSEYSRAELVQLYKDTFHMAPCSKGCTGTYWRGAYDSIVKFLSQNNLNKLPMSEAKYIWNPQYKHITAVYKGYGVDHKCDKQHILEALYNEPKREGLILINPNYKEESSTTENVVPDTNKEPLTGQDAIDKATVLRMKEAGYSNNRMKKETGLQLKTIKEYLND